MVIPPEEICHNHPLSELGMKGCPNFATVELAPEEVPFVPPEARTYYCLSCATAAVATGHYRIVPEDKVVLNYDGMAKEIDELDHDLSSKEADFLDSVLKKLGKKKPLTGKEKKDLEEMHKRYCGSAEGVEFSEKGPMLIDESPDGEGAAADAEE